MSEEPSTERLKAELAQTSAQLNTYPFRQENQRLYALLKSEEGRALSEEARAHIEQRTMQNVVNAVNSDPEIERLFLREHEIEIILRKRQNPDLYAAEGTIERPPDLLP